MPPRVYVRWHCRRCGHRNGIARTTMPILGPETPEAFVRAMRASLLRKLVKVHMRSGCIATVEDFIVERVQDSEAHPLVGVL